MKKLGLLVMPLMAISLLASCNQPTPTPIVDVVHNFHFIGTNCTINGESDYSHDIFEKDKNVQYTIVPYTGYKLPETVEGVEYDSSNGVITINEIKNDIELRVEATHIPQPGVTHTIHLDPAGGKITGSTILINLPDNEPITTAPTISRGGYDASEVKWYTEPDGGGQEFKFGAEGTLVVTDYFLHAKWGDISQFTINFYNDDGNPYNSLQNIKVNYGDKVTYKDCPTDATYDNHYKFDGWYTKKPSEAGAELFPFDTPLTGDSTTISIYAKHSKKQYHVTFDANGGEITSGGTPLDVTYKDSIPEEKRPTVSRSGYEPTITWCTDKTGLNEFTFDSTPITDNTTLYAKWGNPTPSTTYTVTLDAGDGTYGETGSILTLTEPVGTELVPLLKNYIPSLADNTFAYYEYQNKYEAINYDDVVLGNITLKAHYFANNTEKLDDLNGIDWKTIKNISVTGDPSKWFNLGAIKNIYLTVNEQKETFAHSVRIIDFAHQGDKTLSGKQTGLTFEFADVITKSNGDAATTKWNDKQKAASTNYDYRKSTLNDFLNDTEDDGSVINMLPSTLSNVITPVDKSVGVNVGIGSLDYKSKTFSPDCACPKLFQLSYEELGPTGQKYVVSGEGTIYKYYEGHETDNAFRIKRKAGIDTGDGEYYWLRSPSTDFSDYAWRVDGDGGLSNYGVVYGIADAVVPAFCI